MYGYSLRANYMVVGVCSSEEKARAIMAASPRPRFDEWNDPFPLEVDALNALVVRAGRGEAIYQVIMFRDGSTKPVTKSFNMEPFAHGPNPKTFSPYLSTAYISHWVWATSEEHAAKIVNERRIQMIASGEWPPAL